MWTWILIAVQQLSLDCDMNKSCKKKIITGGLCINKETAHAYSRSLQEVQSWGFRLTCLWKTSWRSLLFLKTLVTNEVYTYVNTQWRRNIENLVNWNVYYRRTYRSSGKLKPDLRQFSSHFNREIYNKYLKVIKHKY